MNSPEQVAADQAGAQRASAEATVVNDEGMHLRPATAFAKTAGGSGCSVTVVTERGTADGSSVLELAMLAAPKGTVLRISVEGQDCDSVLASLVRLVAHGFRG